jgi:hypothetical protein
MTNDILEDPSLVELQTGIVNLLFTMLHTLSEKGYKPEDAILLVKNWIESSILETFDQHLETRTNNTE